MSDGQPVAEGYCDPRFSKVKDQFERNFREGGEVGAAVCITRGSKTMVDLWGGFADPTTAKQWLKDTVCVVWSCTKGATALCAHILADRHDLDLNAPIARYWPDFAQRGKKDIPVRMLLNHQAGLPAIRKPLPRGAFYDWDLVVDALAQESPFWEPGTRNGYHALTFGFLVGEVVRRVSGQSLGSFFNKEVAAPLGLDFWIGLPESEEPRVARLIPMPPPQDGEPVAPFLKTALTVPGSLQNLLVFNTGGYMDAGECDTRAAHAAEIPAAGGITNARSLARMYEPLATGGRIGQIDLVSEEAIVRMSAVSSATGMDASLIVPSRVSLGFMKSIDNRSGSALLRDSVILSDAAFGHAGMGGSIGFADPTAQMSFGYVMNRMGPGTTLNERGQSLIDAAYQCCGYRSNSTGFWI